jgi:hypothetical protein
MSKDTEWHSKSWDFFLSYSSKTEHEWTRRLVREIECRGQSVLVDWRIPGGQPVMATMHQAVSRARFGLVVICHAAIESTFVRDEVDEMLVRSERGEMRMVALHRDLTCNVPPWGFDCVLQADDSHNMTTIVDRILMELAVT